eukprot:CAMPEP_0197174498 /NCGR_PEP_ID=MMETSP1423-20130617/994_1 /TAXON_ID=476441 /ORGANISM="Pseudo-nitzschia heimii, Strain UNC1101" /LENGTH=520 /DNA_ID=CAMNT_0042623439 /DNA_START=102 /DNA_END=1664 /DNA_ORIENTATION=+
MAEEQSSESVTDQAGDNDDVGAPEPEMTDANNPEAAIETARSQAEARRRRILEKANNRMKYVNGEQVQDEVEKKTSRSNAARIRAARQRRYGKKSASAAGTTTSTPASAPTTTAPTPTTESTFTEEVTSGTSNPQTESETAEVGGDKEKSPETASETTPSTTSSAATEAATESTAATGPTAKKKYVGVARMRRQMLVKKKMEEENNDPGAGSVGDVNSSKASQSSDGKSSEESATSSSASVAKAGLSQTKVQTISIYMHMVVILLMFVAGFDVGVQQFHVDVDVRSQVAVQEYGVPFVQRNPWNPLTPIAKSGSKDVLEESLSSNPSLSGTGDLKDEFDEEMEEEYIPNIDPIFRVDFDDLTKGPGILNQLARGAIAIHKFLLWLLYYGPMGFFASILSIPTAFVESPPGLFLAAIILRQVVGKGVLGATIPEISEDEGSEGKKQKNIEVIAMAKNFVKNFFMSTFPTLVTIYDVYLHVKADMYVVLCGVFFGLAWTNLNNIASMDGVVGGNDDPSEGEL